jgi:hypothetical protein
VSAHLSAAQIKARLDHPIIDADGHWIEYGPVFTEELRRVGGENAVQGWNAVRNGTRSAPSMSVEERRRRRVSQEAFWGHPSKNTKDLATALFPHLCSPSGSPRSALVDKSGGTGPTAVIGAIQPIVVEPTKRVFLPLVSGGRAVSERQSQSDFDAPGDGGHW